MDDKKKDKIAELVWQDDDDSFIYKDDGGTSPSACKTEKPSKITDKDISPNNLTIGDDQPAINQSKFKN